MSHNIRGANFLERVISLAEFKKPKKFKNGDDLINAWSAFCDWIVENGYTTIPSQTAFCRWLNEQYSPTDRKTIYNTLNKYFPDIKKDFERIQSDTIMQGGMLGHYNSTMSIFGLKNWCGWSDQGTPGGIDAGETEEDALSKALREEAERMENEDTE